MSFKKCPFQSRLVIDPHNGFTGDALLSEFTNGGTAFSDATSGSIDMYSISDDLGEVSDVYYLYAPCIMNKCWMWDEVNEVCGANTAVALTQNTDADVPKASVLIAEFIGNQDLDGDGSIYGYDFVISDDGNKPAMLKAVENSPDWPTILPEEIAWGDYLTSIGEPNSPIGIIGSYNSIEGGYYVGTITYDEITYKLYVAPKTDGELGGNPTTLKLYWDNDQNTLYGATEEYDGYANTEAMSGDIPNFSIATNTVTEFAIRTQSSGINSFYDWYAPSKEEMIVIANNIASKDMSGTDWSDNGESFSSIVGYWTSTEISSTHVWAIAMANIGSYVIGQTLSAKKLQYGAIRLIRRVEV